MDHSTEPLPIGDAYEKRDAHLGPIIKFVVWMAISTAIVLVAMWGMVEGLKKLPLANSDRELHPLALEREVPPPAPRLEMKLGVHKGVYGDLIDEKDPQKPFNTEMIAVWKQRWNQQLTSYGVIDRQAGIYNVPIERAMEIALKKGFPTATKVKN